MYILENGLKGYFKALWEERATNFHIIGLWPLISRPVIFHTNAPIWRSEDNFLLLLSPIIWVLWNQIQAGELHLKSYLHMKLLAWCLFVLFLSHGLLMFYPRLAWIFPCLSIPNAEITGVCHYAPTSTKFFYYMKLDF